VCLRVFQLGIVCPVFVGNFLLTTLFKITALSDTNSWSFNVYMCD